MVAGKGITFYFEGKRSPFLDCVALSPNFTTAQNNWQTFTDKLAFSEQTVGNCCNLLESKAITSMVFVQHAVFTWSQPATTCINWSGNTQPPNFLGYSFLGKLCL